MEGDRCRELAVEKNRDCLKEYLNYYNPPELPPTFWNEDDCLPSEFLVHNSILEQCLHDGNHLQPIGGVS